MRSQVNHRNRRTSYARGPYLGVGDVSDGLDELVVHSSVRMVHGTSKLAIGGSILKAFPGGLQDLQLYCLDQKHLGLTRTYFHVHSVLTIHVSLASPYG